MFGVCVCVCLCVCVFRHAEKTGEKPSIWLQKRLRVYIQNVSVYAGTTRTCVETCARGAGTHGGVFEATHGEQGVIVSSAYQNLPTFGYHVLQRFTKETFGSFLFSSVRID